MTAGPRQQMETALSLYVDAVPVSKSSWLAGVWESVQGRGSAGSVNAKGSPSLLITGYPASLLF